MSFKNTYKKDKDISRKMREIRSFVNFDYDLRKPLHPSQYGKIEKYWDEFNKARGQSVRVYRPKNKKRLSKVKQATGNNLKDFKVAFVPNPDVGKISKVDFTKSGNVVFRDNHVSKTFYPFDAEKLAFETQKEIDFVLSNIEGDSYSIACGGFEYREFYKTKPLLEKGIKFLLGKYNHGAEFILGVNVYHYRDQKNFMEYLKYKSEYKRKSSKQKRKVNAKGRNI